MYSFAAHLPYDARKAACEASYDQTHGVPPHGSGPRVTENDCCPLGVVLWAMDTRWRTRRPDTALFCTLAGLNPYREVEEVANFITAWDDGTLTDLYQALGVEPELCGMLADNLKNLTVWHAGQNHTQP